MTIWRAALLASAVALANAETPATFTNSVGIQMVLIPPGEMQESVFQPVCPDENDPAVKGDVPDKRILWTQADIDRCRQLAKRDASDGFSVSIKKAFYIGKYEITQAEWTDVMGRNPSVFQGSRVPDDSRRHPVDNVKWQDALAFVRKLNLREKTGSYRLPTEFEWEYAGRAGGQGQVGWNEIREQAVQGLRSNEIDFEKPTTQAVGSKHPNAWGLYDMLGNVWEWVQDNYNEKTFPDLLPPGEGTQHVLKGGGFVSDVKNVIYATHAAGPADSWDVGFRIVKDVEP